MAVFTGNFLSVELGRQNSVSVILPHDVHDEPNGGFPVLYLLHGVTDDSRSWLYRSSIERYAMERGICVVMPDVNMSYYADLPYGGKYFAYITRELPEMMNSMFRIPATRQNTFVGGASMGGYGALKCVLTYPDKYAGCIALSPLADIAKTITKECNEGRQSFWKGICGPSLSIDPSMDLFQLVHQANAFAGSPRIYFACGKQDEIFPDNLRLREALDNNHIDFTFEQAGAGHEWGFWDVALLRGIDIIIGQRKGN